MVPLGAGVFCVLGWHMMGSAGCGVAWLKPQSIDWSVACYRIGAITFSLPRLARPLLSSLRSPVSSEADQYAPTPSHRRRGGARGRRRQARGTAYAAPPFRAPVFEQVRGEGSPERLPWQAVDVPCRKVCGPTRLAMSAASAASTMTRYSCRVLIGTIAFRPGKSQPSAWRMPCCRPASHHSPSNMIRPSGSMALR